MTTKKEPLTSTSIAAETTAGQATASGAKPASNIAPDTGEITPFEYFLDHKGNLKMIAQICAVEHIPKRGVIALNASNRPYYWYEQANDDVSLRVRDKLVQMVLSKGHCLPPDWEELQRA